MDFQRTLASAVKARSAHFALHHLNMTPQRAVRAELSTDGAPISPNPVDDLPDRPWLGLVLPKRQARRAVTRSVLRRQMREAVRRQAARLAPGLWVLRLRAPFDPAAFPSASSDALRRTARLELDALLARAVTGR